MDTILEIGSNALPDLAARIRAEHEATSAALKTSVGHAIAAGALLLEAKELLKHGQWLSWLAEHCAISERTAQLYMRCAKNRAAIEANTQCVADLTINEAAAVLMLSSDVQKLFDFAKQAEGLDGDAEAIVSLCAQEGIAVMRDNPFGAKEFSELETGEQLEWYLRILIGVKNGTPLEAAGYYVERDQSRGYPPGWWYGAEGDSWRKRYGHEEMPQSRKDEWEEILASNRERTIDDIKAEVLKSEEARVAQLCAAPNRKRKASRPLPEKED
jgi:Protein of unknown function (DUF3102)